MAQTQPQWQDNGDGTVSQRVVLTGNNVPDTQPVPTKPVGSDIQQPVEIQGVYTEQEKTLSAASVGIGATVSFTSNAVAMISDKGNFTEFGAGCVANAPHNYVFNVLGSPDGTTLISDPLISKSSTSWTKQAQGKSLLDYLVYQITNNDTVTHTYDVYTRKFN